MQTLTSSGRNLARGISANSSVTTTASATADSCENEYGTHCGAILAAEGVNFWPVTYAFTAATKYLIVSDNTTSTSISYNPENFTIPAADYTSYQNYGTFPGTVNDLTVSTLGTTLVSFTSHAL